MLDPDSPVASTWVRIASASAFVVTAPTRTRYPRLLPPASNRRGVGTGSTRASSPAVRSCAAVASAAAWSFNAAGGASGSGEPGPEGMAISTVQLAFGSGVPRRIVVNVTPGASVRVVRVSGRSDGPSGSPLRCDGDPVARAAPDVASVAASSVAGRTMRRAVMTRSYGTRRNIATDRKSCAPSRHPAANKAGHETGQ
jgi:hypothetical protein